MHLNMRQLLQWFKYDHLPENLAEMSKPFCELANEVAATLEGPEAAMCLRKLLEAKDCAVRAKLGGGS